MATQMTRRQLLATGALTMPLFGSNWLGPKGLKRNLTRMEKEQRIRRRPLTGIHLENVPQLGMTHLLETELAIGHTDIVSWYIAWGSGGWADPHPEWADLVDFSGRTPMVTWEPWAWDKNDPTWALPNLVEGKHDPYIEAWAKSIAAAKRHIHLRPMHEMNGGWYPWGGVDPDLYKLAWTHLVDTFDRLGAGAYTHWVWCPVVVDDQPGLPPLEEYWPGSRYVDVMGLDGYCWGTSEEGYGGWRSPAQVFSEPIRRLKALGNGQPIWLCEVGCAPEGGSKEAWISDLYDLARQEWDIDAVVWFSLLKERDWRVQTPAPVAQAVRAR